MKLIGAVRIQLVKYQWNRKCDQGQGCGHCDAAAGMYTT